MPLTKIQSLGITDGTIVNADINASAAIASTKLSGSFGISEVDMWRITANTTNTESAYLTANWERIDVSPEGTSGTGMSESSGVFTFPSTGYWFVSFQLRGRANSGPALFIGPEIHATTNNSTYVQLTEANAGNWDNAAEDTIYTSTILNISDTTNRKVKFYFSQAIAENRITGNTSRTATGATFIKLI